MDEKQFSKKHYERFAEACRRHIPQSYGLNVHDVKDFLVYVFRGDNDAFDPERFREACVRKEK